MKKCNKGHILSKANKYITSKGYIECKICKKLRAEKYYKKKKELYSKRAKKYYKKKKELYSKRAKKYYQMNKEKINKQSKKWRKENPEKLIQYKKKWNKTHPYYTHYVHAHTRCNNQKQINYKNYGGRGIKMLLTPDNIKYLWFRDKAYSMKKPSIDRINNNKNYTLKNCRFIELKENISRGNKGKIPFNAKLTEEKAEEIRKNYNENNITQSDLAKQYKISQSQICNIITFKHWKVKNKEIIIRRQQC